MNALFVQALQLQLNSCVFNTFISLSHPTAAAGDVTKCQQPAHKRSWTHFPFHRTMPFGLNFRRHVSAGFFCFSFFFFISFCWLCRARALAQQSPKPSHAATRESTHKYWISDKWVEWKKNNNDHKAWQNVLWAAHSKWKKQQTFYCDPQNDTLCAVLYMK